MKRVAVFGMGYVGCVTAACLSRDGHRVVGVDIDSVKVELVNRGRSPVAEPGLEQLIDEQVRSGQLVATTDVVSAVKQSEVALIAVGTPSAEDGSVSLTAVGRVVASIAAALRDSGQPYVIVLRSTLLPGILETEIAPILQEALGSEFGERVHLCNNPEFLRETTALKDYDDPPFVVVGADDDRAAETVLGLYAGLTAECITTTPRNAAMVKYACNAFHALKIDFANEIGVLCKAFGADGPEVMRIVCRDTHLNISPAYLRPGFAFGGSCLPKDVRALVRFAQQHAIDIEVLAAILPSNQSHMERALRMIRETGLRQLGILGLSFKAGTDDLRESPQVILAETLLGRGCDIKIYDPNVQVGGLTGANLSYVERHLPHLAALLTESTDEVFAHAELLVICTNVADEVEWQARFQGEVIDLRADLVTAEATSELTATGGSS